MGRKHSRRARHDHMNPDDAIDFVESLGLPDGATLAMVEELSGMEACDGYAAYQGDEESDEYLPPHFPVVEIAKKHRQRIERAGCVLLNFSPWHWQVRRSNPDGEIIADWWPHKSKFRIAGANTTRIGTYKQFCRAVELRAEKNAA